MANYTTLAQLTKRYTEATVAGLAHDGAPPADISDADTIAVIEQQISDASKEVDLYLLGHLDMTDVTNQSRVEPHTATIVMYRLHLRRQTPHSDNTFAAAYELAADQLKGVQKSKLHTQASPQHPTTQTESTTLGSTPVFSDDALSRF